MNEMIFWFIIAYSQFIQKDLGC